MYLIRLMSFLTDVTLLSYACRYRICHKICVKRFQFSFRRFKFVLILIQNIIIMAELLTTLITNLFCLPPLFLIVQQEKWPGIELRPTW
jgi:hypothetical protein